MKEQNENSTGGQISGNAGAKLGLKKEMVPKPSPTPFSAPFVSWFRMKRIGNKLKIAHFRRLSTTEREKYPIEKKFQKKLF